MSFREKYAGEADAESSKQSLALREEFEASGEDLEEEEEPEAEEEEEDENSEDLDDNIGRGMLPEGFAGPNVVKPLTPEALAAYKAAQDLRHLMSSHGEVGRVYLQQEDAKRAYLRRKYTATKKPHFTEGWVEFKDKRVARSVAEMLNAQPIGGKKGTRWRDDVWTMKYLPKFKWNMLTEQVAHEAAIHTAKLRVELSQSRSEQREYLRNVELARVLEKRSQRKKEKGEEMVLKPHTRPGKRPSESEGDSERKRRRNDYEDSGLGTILGSIF
ncbi:hypothetical protein C8R42DRAFT_698821 [Lentinula raphanica]|nr:hypothetical protein C8R42DRAFT_698821 [Lentinula raphanica]